MTVIYEGKEYEVIIEAETAVYVVWKDHHDNYHGEAVPEEDIVLSLRPKEAR